jgi:hypothetical protein
MASLIPNFQFLDAGEIPDTAAIQYLFLTHVALAGFLAYLMLLVPVNVNLNVGIQACGAGFPACLARILSNGRLESLPHKGNDNHLIRNRMNSCIMLKHKNGFFYP